MIATSVLRTAISYTKCGKSYLNNTVSYICKGLWDREFMAIHSVSGRKSPTDKSSDKAKPKLPGDAVQAITNFIISFWKSQHHLDISPKEIRSSISAKLLCEHSAKKATDLMTMMAVADAGNNQLEAIDAR
ncbi:hypothetical protein OUZ56_005937 [Daphnia magna]|uniref:BEN domain-containing protein n=1 Tax=Daphnia magna TaxID=35525 RepID=A0ABQ9YVK3_9CRUS|nr:hypothetical protein OUZ56_005937 [Daphnia magna]